MALTIDQIKSTQNDCDLIILIFEEASELLDEELKKGLDFYFAKMQSLPVGLRMMVGINSFDTTMGMDDLAWHFCNWQDERDLSATVFALRELGLHEIAEAFLKQWEFMKPYCRDWRSKKLKKIACISGWKRSAHNNWLINRIR